MSMAWMYIHELMFACREEHDFFRSFAPAASMSITAPLSHAFRLGCQGNDQLPICPWPASTAVLTLSINAFRQQHNTTQRMGRLTTQLAAKVANVDNLPPTNQLEQVSLWDAFLPRSCSQPRKRLMEKKEVSALGRTFHERSTS